MHFSGAHVKIGAMPYFSRNGSLRWALLLVLSMTCVSAVARHHRSHNQTESVAGQFDYYLLSLSWSPSYCLTHQEDQAQCGAKGYGFVVHGLWPQYANGGYPQNCATDATLTAEATAVGNSLYPSPKLVAHEWQRHGTCSGLDAVSYFRTVDRAAAAVQVPAPFQAPRAPQSMGMEQIAAAFHAANPRLSASGMVIACSRDVLSEVRVCLDRNLALMPCGRGVRNSCPTGVAVSLPASR